MVENARVSFEVRHGHITKEEGKALIKKFDGEYPKISRWLQLYIYGEKRIP